MLMHSHTNKVFSSSAAVFFLCLKIRLKNQQKYLCQIIMKMAKRKFFGEMHKKVFRWFVYSNELMPK